MLGKEPTLIIQSLNAALQAIQWSAIPMSTGLHVAVTIVVSFVAAVTNRMAVTPVAKTKP